MKSLSKKMFALVIFIGLVLLITLIQQLQHIELYKIIGYTFIAICCVVIILNIFDKLAKKGILFIYPIQGSMIAIVAGGTYVKLIYSISKHVFDEKSGEMVDGDRTKSLLEIITGAQFIGIPPSRKPLHFDLAGEEYGKEDGKEGQSLLSFNKKGITTLFFRHPYAAVVKDAETGGNIPVNMRFQVVLVRKRPLDTFFGNGTPGKGLDLAIGLVISTAREILREMNIDSVLGFTSDGSIKKEGSINTDRKTMILDCIYAIKDQLLTETGYLLELVTIESVEPSVTQKELETLRKKPIAQMEAVVLLIEAEASKKATILASEAEATAIEQISVARSIEIANISVAEATAIENVSTAQAKELERKAKVMSASPEAAHLQELMSLENTNLSVLGSDSKVQLLVNTPKDGGAN